MERKLTEREQQDAYGCLLFPFVAILAVCVFVGIPLGFWYESTVDECAVACAPLDSSHTALGVGCVYITADNYLVRPPGGSDERSDIHP